jgi:hypothetical protein
MKSISRAICLVSLLTAQALGSTTTLKRIDNIQNTTGGSSLSIPSTGTTFDTDSNSIALTNKTISGASNTLSNIPNSATTATSASTASTIVARDSSKNFATNEISLDALTGGSLLGTSNIAASLLTIDDSITQMDRSGFTTWSAGGPYWSSSFPNFTLLVGGTGYIHGKKVTWAGSQTTAIPANTSQLIYIDSAGTIQKTASPFFNESWEDVIPLFVVMNDGTNIIVTKENHDYDFGSDQVNYNHITFGTILAGSGANITRVSTGTGGAAGDRQLSIVGADSMNDSELLTTISDTAGAAISILFYYTNGSGHWTQYASQTQFPMVYDSAGTVTALPTGTGHFGVFVLYVAKDQLNSATPIYIAVMDNTNYNNTGLANTAITNGTLAVATNELNGLQLAQLGYIIVQNNGSSGFLNTVIIAKSKVGSTLASGANVNSASLISLNTGTFTNFFTAADTTVQTAFNTLDAGIVSTNTASTIVKRDSSGNFTAGTVTAALTGTASGNTTYTPNNHGMIVSSSTNAMTVVAPDASTTKVWTSGGTGADPSWQAVSTGTWAQEDVTGCNGSATGFTLAHTPATSLGVSLYLDGVVLRQGASKDYTISGTSITLGSACQTGQNLYAVYLY